MPIYEYACQACGHRFERLLSIGASTPACPECGGSDVRKLVSAAAFVLKGSGWYKDLYGLQSGARSTGSSTSESAAAPKAPSTSTEHTGASK